MKKHCWIFDHKIHFRLQSRLLYELFFSQNEEDDDNQINQDPDDIVN